MIPDPDLFMRDTDPFGPELYRAARAALDMQGAGADDTAGFLDCLPGVRPSQVDLHADRVIIGSPSDLDAAQSRRLRAALLDLKPWRKGPFRLFGIDIDSEWDSALKWRRVAPHMAPLQDRKILDVGSSNGYYLYRMAADRPRLVIGVEPYMIYYRQFLALQSFLPLPGIYGLPLKLEDLPQMDRWFDTIFCMGIIYHRRSPLDTLRQLKGMLKNDGQLILETLIISGEEETALFPRDRYARMRNVFFIPTVKCLGNWLERCGFARVRCVDITPTTTQEQRKTPWIDSQSLDACLDPVDGSRTLEGYPAPVRAVVVAGKK